MIEKGKISSAQMAIMMHPTIIATGLLLVPSITAAKAGRDMWISPLWGSLIGFFVVYIAYQLHKHFPKETIIEYSEHIVGRIPGKVIGFLYLFFYLHVNGMILREYGEFLMGIFLLKTPGIVVIASMVLVCAFAVRGGLEVVARTAQLFLPVVILLWLLIIIFLIPDLDPTNMLPVFEKGVMPSILGAAAPAAWLSEYLLIAFLLPYVTDKEKGLLWGNLSVLSVVFILVLTNLTALFLFGEITADLLYPVMNAGKYIDVAHFFTHLESVIMAIWILGTFIKISVFYYALALGTAQWLKLSEYKFVVLPLGFLLVTVAVWSTPNLIDLKSFLGTSSVFYLLSFQLVLPSLLLLINLLRKKRTQQKGAQA
ncbi:endospore germination permease [Alkalihalobacillus sp. BA299]|uniref:GerAB/ArcD/ProY family transporter n=1 Tax=Alkalihalobacillus sp. BA299 TaxID=2815938 RepID=UPI001AD95C96|nr:endospore germination permease [Alkalihalobacillus sp. BA299]